MLSCKSARRNGKISRSGTTLHLTPARGDVSDEITRLRVARQGIASRPQHPCAESAIGAHNGRIMKLASFEALVTALESAGARYLVAGGLAVNAYGYLRFTKYVDLRNNPSALRFDPDVDSHEGGRRPQDRIDIEHLRMRLEDNDEE